MYRQTAITARDILNSIEYVEKLLNSEIFHLGENERYGNVVTIKYDVVNTESNKCFNRGILFNRDECVADLNVIRYIREGLENDLRELKNRLQLL